MVKVDGILGKRNYQNICTVINTVDHMNIYITIKITVQYDANDQEKRDNFWIFKLQTFHPQGLNTKIILQDTSFNMTLYKVTI